MNKTKQNILDILELKNLEELKQHLLPFIMAGYLRFGEDGIEITDKFGEDVEKVALTLSLEELRRATRLLNEYYEKRFPEKSKKISDEIIILFFPIVLKMIGGLDAVGELKEQAIKSTFDFIVLMSAIKLLTSSPQEIKEMEDDMKILQGLIEGDKP